MCLFKPGGFSIGYSQITLFFEKHYCVGAKHLPVYSITRSIEQNWCVYIILCLCLLCRQMLRPCFIKRVFL
ncbi:hypothetical protein KsCSTR_31260 [Candidatus Kuenenia stuttgartiensis]|uniref:Uncharacterized protein n=1 Tax=Kuenenia stuttgartiensis TaxID=174633 RepID=Q1Q510_KUEST|nr:hypothetical protein KsCSTR_31260 [Candidatus Kuenenia stuttgartiensis]CAJ75095.1 unknown protein [Candidatus Kuenenia stuttgartiensis]